MTSRFDSLGLSKALLEVVAELGYEHPTPIQAQCIPLLLQGKDLIGQSQTGSGKTAAFTLPVLGKIQVRNRRIQALILCPTRELCTQVAREMRKLGRKNPGLQVLILAGGQPIFPQVKSLEKGAHIAVGTPGRVLDHLQRRTLDLRQAGHVVLDEADRMLDMGFEEDMKKILTATPPSRQTALFSATYPRTIEALGKAYLREPVRVTIEEESHTKPAIRQVVYEVNPEKKTSALLWLFQQKQPEAAIVFCNLKATIGELTGELIRNGVSAAGLHGDLEQFERDRIMAKFRNQSTRVLIATDVAARGIDVEGLDLVVNFDLPPQPDVYVHRIGRTGRAGKTGVAVSFATSREGAKLKRIEEVTGSSLTRKTLAPSVCAEARENRPSPLQDAKMETLRISGGRKEKVRPGDILGALTGEAGRLNASSVGKIEIHDHFSYVAIAKDVARIALQRLSQGQIKGRRFRVDLLK